jgi:hypothetical protein
MRHRTLAAIALLLQLPLLVGCKSTPKDRLQGRWVGEGLENFASAQAARAMGWVRGTSFEFRGNRVTVTVPAESPRQGTFSISQQGADTMRVAFVRPQGTRDEVELQFVEPDLVRWNLGDGRGIRLRKHSD